MRMWRDWSRPWLRCPVRSSRPLQRSMFPWWRWETPKPLQSAARLGNHVTQQGHCYRFLTMYTVWKGTSFLKHTVCPAPVLSCLIERVCVFPGCRSGSQDVTCYRWRDNPPASRQHSQRGKHRTHTHFNAHNTLLTRARPIKDFWGRYRYKYLVI